MIPGPDSSGRATALHRPYNSGQVILTVIPAEAGIQDALVKSSLGNATHLDPGLHQNDGQG